MEVEVVALARRFERPSAAGSPGGLEGVSNPTSFNLAAIGERAQFRFTVTAPPQPGTAKIIAERRNRRSPLSQPTRGNQLSAYPSALASTAGRSESDWS